MAGLSRREMLGSAALVGGWLAFGARGAWGQPADAGGSSGGPYELPPLPYGYADLEPHVDAQTLRLHHDIHHAGYVKGANAALAELERIRQQGGEAIQQVRAVTANLSFAASGVILHNIFWESMTPRGGGDPPADSDIGRMIKRDFGSVEAFRAHLAAASAQVQGSGWGVLGYEPVSQRLMVLAAEKHENGTAWGIVPLLVIDVWEHAYYLKYQNKRSDFIKAVMDIIHWESAEAKLHQALQHT